MLFNFYVETKILTFKTPKFDLKIKIFPLIKTKIFDLTLTFWPILTLKPNMLPIKTRVLANVVQFLRWNQNFDL